MMIILKISLIQVYLVCGGYCDILLRSWFRNERLIPSAVEVLPVGSPQLSSPCKDDFAEGSQWLIDEEM